MKILVVDDDNIIRRGLCKVLKRLDDTNEVEGSFQNGKTALEYLKENYMSVDLVIKIFK